MLHGVKGRFTEISKCSICASFKQWQQQCARTGLEQFDSLDNGSATCDVLPSRVHFKRFVKNQHKKKQLTVLFYVANHMPHFTRYQGASTNQPTLPSTNFLNVFNLSIHIRVQVTAAPLADHVSSKNKRNQHLLCSAGNLSIPRNRLLVSSLNRRIILRDNSHYPSLKTV